MGNIDIVPTLAKLMGLTVPANGTLKGRILTEALTGGTAPTTAPTKSFVSAPTESNQRTRLEYEEVNGVRYNNRACLIDKETTPCP